MIAASEKDSRINVEHTTNPSVEKPTPIEDVNETPSGVLFENKAKGYQFAVPDGFSIYESSGNVYVRNNDTYSQIAIIFIPGTFNDGIQVYESSINQIYRLMALLKDENGSVEEKGVKNYGTKPKADKRVGSFDVKTEEAEIWWRNTGEPDDIILPSYDYFTTFNGNGLVLLGCTQTESSSTMIGYMDSILESFEHTEPEAKSMEFKLYQANTPDETMLKYPSSWEVHSNSDGMVYIKAAESQADPYAGMLIEIFADTDNKYVEDYAQFTANYERQFMAPTFIQMVGYNDYEVEGCVKKMDFDKKLGDKDCIYMEVDTTIKPYSTAVKNSLGINGNMIHNIRYTYKSGTTDCCINFVIPEGNTAAEELMEQIVESIHIA